MNLLIIGAGQYGMVVKEIALTTGRFDKIDFWMTTMLSLLTVQTIFQSG